MNVIDIFKYFASFPLKSAVDKIFSNGKSTITGYAELRTEISNLAVHSRIADIKGFVFGSDEDFINLQVSKMNDTFLFLEYGELNSSKDNKNSISNSWPIAVSILKKLDNERDPVEFALNSNSTLSIIRAMLIAMTEDQSTFSWLKYLSDNYEIVPLNHKKWSAYGWTLLFKMEGADLLNVKNF